MIEYLNTLIYLAPIAFMLLFTLVTLLRRATWDYAVLFGLSALVLAVLPETFWWVVIGSGIGVEMLYRRKVKV